MLTGGIGSEKGKERACCRITLDGVHVVTRIDTPGQLPLLVILIGPKERDRHVAPRLVWIDQVAHGDDGLFGRIRPMLQPHQCVVPRVEETRDIADRSDVRRGAAVLVTDHTVLESQTRSRQPRGVGFGAHPEHHDIDRNPFAVGTHNLFGTNVADDFHDRRAELDRHTVPPMQLDDMAAQLGTEPAHEWLSEWFDDGDFNTATDGRSRHFAADEAGADDDQARAGDQIRPQRSGVGQRPKHMGPRLLFKRRHAARARSGSHDGHRERQRLTAIEYNLVILDVEFLGSVSEQPFDLVIRAKGRSTQLKVCRVECSGAGVGAIEMTAQESLAQFGALIGPIRLLTHDGDRPAKTVHARGFGRSQTREGCSNDYQTWFHRRRA